MQALVAGLQATQGDFATGLAYLATVLVFRFWLDGFDRFRESILLTTLCFQIQVQTRVTGL